MVGWLVGWSGCMYVCMYVSLIMSRATYTHIHTHRLSGVEDAAEVFAGETTLGACVFRRTYQHICSSDEYINIYM